MSALDEVRDVMLERAALPGITKGAIHEYLPDRRADLGLPGHSAFTEYRRRTGIEAGASAREAHPRFETAPGASCSSTGGALGARQARPPVGLRRLHRDALLVEAARARPLHVEGRRRPAGLPGRGPGAHRGRAGGVPHRQHASPGRGLGRQAQEVGAGVEVRPRGRLQARALQAEVAGDEGRGREREQLRGQAAGLRGRPRGRAGARLADSGPQARRDAEPNATAGLPPATPLMREEEHLGPIGSARLLEEMAGDVSARTVPSTMLVRAAGRERSVPRRRVGRRATAASMPGGQIRVAMSGELVAAHDASGATGRTNHAGTRHAEATEGKRAFADRDIIEAARANLELLDGAGGDR